MSYKAVEVAITTRAPSHAAKLVLICMAHHYNHLTGKCCPSYERMAEMMGLAKSSITRAVKELVDAKLIGKRKGKRTGTHEGPNHYRLLFYIQARMEEADAKKRLRYGDVHVLTTRPEHGTPSSPPLLSGEEARTKRKRSQRRALKTRMQEDWKPTERQRAYAIERGFTEAETDLVAERFKYWWIGDGGVKANWGAVWYTWITNDKARKEQANEQQSGNPGARSRGQQRYESLRSLDAAVRRDAEERRRREGCGEEGSG